MWGAASARPTARKRKSVVGGSHLNERVVPVTPAPGLLLAPVPIELGARDHETARELPPGRDDPPCGKNNPGDASCLRGTRVLHATASGVTKSSPPRGGGVQQAASRRQTQQHMPFSAPTASLFSFLLNPRKLETTIVDVWTRDCESSKKKKKRKRLDVVSVDGVRVRFGRNAEDPSGDKNRTARDGPRALCYGWCGRWGCPAFGPKPDHEGKTGDIRAGISREKYKVHAISTLDFPIGRLKNWGQFDTPQHRGE